jgi:hypothetical protein
MKEPGKAQLKLVLVGLAVACILSEPHTGIAQRSGSLPYPPPNPNRGATQASSPPGANVRGGGTALDRHESSVDPETRLLRRRAAAELAEDLDRLRRINREKILPLSSSQSLDYKVLSQVTGEINGRAKRIKSNSPVALREKKGEKRTYEADAAHLGSMLPELSRLIESFLANPVFSTASVHDDDLRSTAGRDLDSIIRLSDTISKLAKRLAKPATESAKGQRA